MNLLDQIPPPGYLVNQGPINAGQIEQTAASVIELVTEGDINPLELDMRLKAIESVCEKIRKHTMVKECVIEEAQKHGAKGEFDFMNCVARVGEFGARYDYAGCNDTELNELVIKIKARQKFLKELDIEMVDENTGEIISPAVKKSTTSVSYRFV